MGWWLLQPLDRHGCVCWFRLQPVVGRLLLPRHGVQPVAGQLLFRGIRVYPGDRQLLWSPVVLQPLLGHLGLLEKRLQSVDGGLRLPLRLQVTAEGRQECFMGRQEAALFFSREQRQSSECCPSDAETRFPGNSWMKCGHVQSNHFCYLLGYLAEGNDLRSSSRTAAIGPTAGNTTMRKVAKGPRSSEPSHHSRPLRPFDCAKPALMSESVPQPMT